VAAGSRRHLLLDALASMFSIQPECQIFRQADCSAGTRTRRAQRLRTAVLDANTACAELSIVKPSGAVKVKPSLGCRNLRPRTKPSLGPRRNQAVEHREIFRLVALTAPGPVNCRALATAL